MPHTTRAIVSRFSRLTFLPGLLLLLAAGRAFAEDKAAQPREFTVRAADGLELACQEYGAGDTALLFLHGWCGTHEYWKHQVGQFDDHYRVVTIDQAGHGRSGTNRDCWTIKDLAADVEAVVNSLKLQRVVLIGHSMGGPVSLAAAPLLKERLVAIVGVDTLHNAEYVWVEDEAKGFLSGLETNFKVTMRAGLKGLLRTDVDPKLLEWITSGAESQDPRMALGLMTDMTRLDTQALLSQVKAPIRCINSAPTFVFALPTETAINKKYANFDAVVMDNVGHYPMLEKPDEFNDRLVKILQEVAPN